MSWIDDELVTLDADLKRYRQFVHGYENGDRSWEQQLGKPLIETTSAMLGFYKDLVDKTEKRIAHYKERNAKGD